MGARKYVDIEVRGVIYPNANAVAEAFGVSVCTARDAIRQGRLNSLGTYRGRRPVTIRGVTYESFSAAARALGVAANTVRAAYRNGTLHRVGTGRVGVEPLPVRIAGQDFESARAAAEHFKVPVGTVYSAICDGDPDRIVRPKRYNPWKSRPFSVGGLTFPSMRAASRELGFKNEEYVATVVKRGSRRGRERILAAAMAYAAKQGGV